MSSTALSTTASDRIRRRDEVWTAEREVDAMLDLVQDESYKINSRFLEPSCGTGNFLIKIIERKMQTVIETAKDDEHFQFLSLVAISYIYAVDIMPDNVNHSRQRIFDYIINTVTEHTDGFSHHFRQALKYIIRYNFIVGDFLNKQSDINFIKYDTPRISADLTLNTNDNVKSLFSASALYKFRLIEYNFTDLENPLRKSKLVSMENIMSALPQNEPSLFGYGCSSAG